MAWSHVWDVVFPPKCGLCASIGEPAVCPECRAEFKPLDLAPVVWHGPIAWRMALFAFEGRAAQAVRRLKYARVTSLGPPLSQLLAAGLEVCPTVDAVVPVPIHWTRRAMRGFNQSELLCAAVPSGLVRPALAVRNRRTRPQVELSAVERAANLDGAFDATGDVLGKSVVLIDDVVTTGGTASACAEALLAAGAKSVGLLALCGEQGPHISGLKSP